MATFVHNEPTSLGIIQEAGLPEAFYKAIEIGLEPAIEVRSATVNIRTGTERTVRSSKLSPMQLAPSASMKSGKHSLPSALALYLQYFLSSLLNDT